MPRRPLPSRPWTPTGRWCAGIVAINLAAWAAVMVTAGRAGFLTSVAVAGVENSDLGGDLVRSHGGDGSIGSGLGIDGGASRTYVSSEGQAEAAAQIYTKRRKGHAEAATQSHAKPRAGCRKACSERGEDADCRADCRENPSKYLDLPPAAPPSAATIKKERAKRREALKKEEGERVERAGKAKKKADLSRMDEQARIRCALALSCVVTPHRPRPTRCAPHDANTQGAARASQLT